MAVFVDSITYDKAKRFPPRHGYQLRGTQPTSIVVHSTSNSRKNTAFAGEAKYLLESADVSAHYLISKDGLIVQFLEPGPWQAWHAGHTNPAFQNSRSIGIELHHSVADPPYPKAQIDALTWLVRDLARVFQIAPAAIETHGQIAIPGPYQRKRDPSDWPYTDFLRWRAELDAPPPPAGGLYQAAFTQAVFEAPRGDAKIALNRMAMLTVGQQVEIDGVNNGFAHLASGLGFVPVSVLEKL